MVTISLLQLLVICNAAVTPLVLPKSAHDAEHDRDLEAVKTTSGKYIGHNALQANNVTEYLGIRYAQPATGNFRFAAPVSYESEHVFQASTQPYDCPYVAEPWGIVPGELWSHTDRIMAQESADGYNAMSEDCLALNIWTPAKLLHKPKPVMVFLYGGGQLRRDFEREEP